jgi:lysophospholipase L1-like esterase
MTNAREPTLRYFMPVLLAAWAFGCSSSSDEPVPTDEGTEAGIGGSASTGGAKGTGGSASTGGAKGTGGSASTGGAKGTGGSASTGGAKGTGGSSNGKDASSNDASGRADTGGPSPGYDPCPAEGTPCVVMPLGDSITYGDGSSNHAGYRAPLFHLALTNQKSVTFVGGMTDGPDTVDGVPFPKHHEGHSGYEIDGVAGFAAAAITSWHPQIVLMMLGTNDIAFGYDVANAPTRLGALIDIVTGADPSLLLIVAQIVPCTDDAANAQIQTLNAAIPALVDAKAAAGAHVRMVDMYGAITANANYKTETMFNKWHPNDAGYVKMADIWYASIGSTLR